MTADALNEHAQRRRIVWVAVGGQVVPPHPGRAGPVKVGEVSSTIAPYDRRESVDVHLYAETLDATDALLDAVVVALNRVLGTCRPTYRWATQEADASGRQLRSHKVVLRLTLHFPVIETPAAHTAIGSHVITASFDV